MASTYKVTATVLNYGGSVEPTMAEVAQEESIVLNIQPKDGFDIINVTNNGTPVTIPEDGKYNFTPESDCDINIEFRKTEDHGYYYGIEIKKSENGGVKLNPGDGYMDDNIAVIMSGASPTFHIIPNDGYEVSDVLVDGSSVCYEGIETYQFSGVKENHTITATFKPAQPTDTVTINTSSNPKDGGDTYGGGKYNVGDNVTISAQPNEGYRFDCWTNEKGDVISKKSTFEFTADYDRTLIANFVTGGDMTPTQKAIYTAAAEMYRNIMFQFDKMETLLMENKIRPLHDCVATMERTIRRFGDTLRENGCD